MTLLQLDLFYKLVLCILEFWADVNYDEASTNEVTDSKN